ncbi:MAG: hypothetical protein RBS02_01510 [Steroidobacteraceae bacterium]|jgi:hypothetical protein|nr:hypothetical protein [Steroidobacteraceae bacterium]
MYARRTTLAEHRFRLGPAASLALPFWWVYSSAQAEPAIGQFELKTLESASGRLEFQSQNAWSWRHPPRRIAATPDGIVFDENEAVRARHALEVEVGLTRTLKMRVGVEFERERIEEPPSIHEANAFDDLSLTELGAEIIVVLSAREGDGGGFGLVAELEHALDREDPNRIVLGGVMEWRSGRWFAAAIPMLVHDFGGEPDEGEKADDKWDFGYAAQLKYTLSERWSLALEGYGVVERLGRTGRPSEAARLFGDFDQHRLGPVLYYTRDFGASRDQQATAGSALSSPTSENENGVSLSIGLGLLEGLNSNTADHTLKLSIEVDF